MCGARASSLRAGCDRCQLESLAARPQTAAVMTGGKLPKISLGFVVRRCTLELGRRPTAREFRGWSDTAGEQGMALFGRRITEQEAELILRHLGRPVTARSARPHEVAENDELPPDLRASGDVRAKIVDFAAVRARARRQGGRRAG